MTDSRGELYPAGAPTVHRLPAPASVAALVRWFWIPEWDVPAGRVSRQELIAYPACNLVVEPEVVGLAGPTTRRSFRDLTGRGWAVGALLRPAAVPHLVADPAALRDRYEPVHLPGLHAGVVAAMAGDGGGGVRRESEGDVRRARAVAAFAAWLAVHLPAPGEEALIANAMADLIDGDPTVRLVTDVAAGLGTSPRTLQRLARRYVGLPPAAMIRRRRLQEAAQRLRTDPETDIAAVAADLGYADHAHLAGDFRTVLGLTPSAYRGAAAGLQRPSPDRDLPAPAGG
ncbi:helix-turn-helix domain-containing protein [Georgenia sp. TF02-10]|uniref:helix-turn-helix domain-containing protein n=1 Tax=Georgenia sp. TF02-10 TaxID=2917725 RepID=UPI001FA6E568|nr:helix-turn-helix domain-containing protein [Georgenia sp. TF02-10]UNX53644.1 helix-turn-helix domain-containing protein [Georgenia sp. TF02-10]